MFQLVPKPAKTKKRKRSNMLWHDEDAKSVKDAPKNSSPGQRLKLTKRIAIALVLCAGVPGCKTTTCLVITQSTDGAQKALMNQAITAYHSQKAKPTSTSPLKSAAADVSAADSTALENGR